MENVLENDTELAVENELAVESDLTAEISNLWTEHVRVAGQKKASAKELRVLRAKLAEKLFDMKALLCRPGRGGEWRGWLSTTVKIPRSTADRLVERHAEMSGATTGNVPTGAISPQEEVEKLIKVMVPRLRKVLASSQLAYQYVLGVIKEFDLPCETKDGGILLAQPASQQELTSESEPYFDDHGADENIDETHIESEFDTSQMTLDEEMASL